MAMAPGENVPRQGLRLLCRGVVQGVGFRPAVARLAGALGLAGRLANIPGAVRIELAGARPELEQFLAQLPGVLPAAARLEVLQIAWLPPPLPAVLAEGSGLHLSADDPRALGIGLMAPSLVADRAPCADCRRELSDPRDRRFRDPFISCCSCGPRYSIATAEPFSRAHTSLACFPPCSACQAEFDDPTNRRYHAETIGCPACGPRLQLLAAGGQRLAGGGSGDPRPSRVCLDAAAEARPRRGEEAPAGTRPGAATPAQAEPQAVATANPEIRPDPGNSADPRGTAARLRTVDPLAADDPPETAASETAEPLDAAVALLRSGRILALQGVGGFQLLVDGRDADAVARLRQRKRRPHKPFALLVDRLERLADLVRPSPEERAALEDPAAPIVLLPCPDDAHETALAGVAPGAPGLGVMLPASPLHQLLAEAFAGPLVATSGNRSGEPLCIDASEAVERLAGIADGFLVHDRPIARPLDDSVLQLIDGRPALLRRARGYAPQALTLPEPQTAPMALAPRAGPSDPARPQTSEPAATQTPQAHGKAPRHTRGNDGSVAWLGLGSDLKSAPALAIGDQLWIAPHLGDLADPRCLERWRAGIAELLQRQRGTLAAVAMDGHPQYVSAQLAGPLLATEATSDRPPLHPVAHHRAHGLAVAAEHGLALPLAALVLDGLGHGGGPVPLWGCELLWLESGGARRLASLRPFPLPGGERAVREPRRSALGLLWAAELLEHPGAAAVRAAFDPDELRLLHQALATGCNSPWCSSAGRLFDAVAALLDLVQTASHDAHAGLLLQAGAGRAAVPAGAYPLPLRTPSLRQNGAPAPDARHDERLARLDWKPLLAALLDDIAAGRPGALCAARFQQGLIEGLAGAVVALAGQQAVRGAEAPGQGRGPQALGLQGHGRDQRDSVARPLVLAGGCFQNRLLLEGMIQALRRRGWRPHWAERLPGNDGGLAAGQILALRQAGASTTNQH